MPDALILSHHLCHRDWREIRAAAEGHLAAKGLRPDLIYLAGGCEEHILGLSASRNFLAAMRSAYPEAGARLVHQGCLGLFGAIKDFKASGRDCAVVVCDESSAALSQRCLSVAGVGIGMGSDGMKALPGLAMAVLVRKPAAEPEDICIADLRIYAQSGGIEGTRSLLRKMWTAYRRFEEADAEIVSFSIHSPWSRALLLDLLPRKGRRDWLPSAEQDFGHLMSTKPLHEAALYEPRSQPLVIVTLGLGGRIGFMQLSRGSSAGLLEDEEASVAIALPPPTMPLEISDDGRPSKLRALASLDPRHRGIDGLYFVSEIPAEPTVTVVPTPEAEALPDAAEIVIVEADNVRAA